MPSVVYKGLWWEVVRGMGELALRSEKENVLFAAQKASDVERLRVQQLSSRARQVIERAPLDAERRKKKLTEPL